MQPLVHKTFKNADDSCVGDLTDVAAMALPRYTELFAHDLWLLRM